MNSKKAEVPKGKYFCIHSSRVIRHAFHLLILSVFTGAKLHGHLLPYDITPHQATCRG